MSGHLPVAAFAAATAVALVVVALFRRSRGPLAKIPGPEYTKYTCAVISYHSFKGSRIHYLDQLHKQYGPMVRVSPAEVSVADLQATREIHKTAGGFLKTDFYSKFVIQDTPSLFSTNDTVLHAKLRRLLAPTMSESNVKNLQPTVQGKIDLLISQLKREHEVTGRVDIFKWAHFFATDVIGDLAFGESFKMLELGKNNDYINDIVGTSKLNTQRMMLTGRPMSDLPQLPIWPFKQLFAARDRMKNYAQRSLDRYRAYIAAHPHDKSQMFFSRVMKTKDNNDDSSSGLSDDLIISQAQGFLVAGTDTTAVTLTYIIYMLATHPEVRAQILSAVADLPEHPSNEELRHIPLLENVIEETLRLYGAAPAPLPRRVPDGGRTLGGHFIPEGQTVSPVAYVLHRDASIFPDPLAWKPERWEEPTEDMRHAFTAFGGGSRVCIGLHLARMELRMATVAFLRAFPDATPAFGVEGFSDESMRLMDFFIVKPQGQKCLIK